METIEERRARVRKNMRQTREEWRSHGLCTHCGQNPSIDPTKQSSRCRDCLNTWMAPENRDKRNAALKRYQYRCREACFERYGRKCECCGEANQAFLEFDHIHNDGAEHRKEYSGSLPVWLVSHEFPVAFEIQVLCRNCNWAKFKYGKCPHQA